jgi:uncharacterized membrane protein YcgQ (UPF0703/DUF1980 family)
MHNSSFVNNLDLPDVSKRSLMFITHISVFLSYSTFTLYLLATGEITRFLSPRLVWLTYLSGFSMGLFLWVLSMRQLSSHKKPVWKEIIKSIMLIYPLFLFFIVNPSDISSVNIPAVKTIPAQKPATKRSMLTSLPTNSEGYVRLNLFELWLLARNYPELTERYKFKTIGVVSDITEKYITVSRLFITCCAADALPVEVEIIKPANENDNKKVFSKGDWLEVSGAIIIKDFVIILPDTIRALPGQAETYITRWSEEPPFNP